MTKLLSSTVCDKIFDYLPLFDETVRHKELCNIQIASSVKYSEIRQNFSNSVGECRFFLCNLLNKTQQG